jgi:tetratricopeptide (TPR) repeat protein
MEEGIPFCEICWQALDKGATPPMDFPDYFSDGLEEKLKQVDTLLFTLPSNHFLWYLKGHLEHELGDTKKALRSLNSSLNYDERFGDSWIRLGLVYSDLHREDDAIDSYEKGLEHPLTDPTNLIDAGIPLIASGNPRLASRLLIRALDLVPQDDRALVNYGKALVQLGELVEAKRVFEKSLQLYPHNEEVLRGMAQMMLKMEDLDTSTDMYYRILDQHPSDFEALLAMGEISLKKGELGQAMKYYREVRDLDISISWSGIIRFILSTLKNRLARNENMDSYREDLRKEHDNINRFMKDLDSRLTPTQGPEMLHELEGLVRVIESLRMTVREQMVQFEEFMKRYEEGDPFRAHLEERLGTLSSYLKDGRYFDAKQIALELSPFLSEVRTTDPKGLLKLRETVRKRLKEFEEVGLGSEAFLKKLEEADALEKDGKLDRSLFLFKELETSLEEHYQVNGKRYYESKMREMRELLDKARDQFDVTGLTRLYESFGNLLRKGPLAIRDAYMEFLKRYEEDSASYYVKEGDRFLKEVQYKIVIMEKEGADVSSMKGSLKRIKTLQEEGGPPKKFFTESYNLLENATDLELKHKVKGIKDRISSLDLLLKQMDELGLDDELARNVDPVIKVIERSLAGENFKLAEVLTNEVMENVERVLRENYLGPIKAALQESKGEVERLRSFKVQDRGWEGLIDGIGSIIDDPAHNVSMMHAVRDLARIQSEVHGFYIDRLPGEIDLKVERCRKLLEEGVSQGLNMRTESDVLRKLMVNVKKISSFEILEEASKFEDELDSRIRAELGTRTSQMVRELKVKIERYTAMGLPQTELLGAVAAMNRADVMMESGNTKDAYRSAQEAQRTIGSIEERYLKVQLNERRGRLRELEATSKELGLDISKMAKDLSKAGSEDDLETNITRADSVIKKLNSSIMESVRKRADSLKVELFEVVRKSSGFITDDEEKVVERELDGISKGLSEDALRGLPSILKRISASIVGMGDRVQERSLLERCSSALEVLSEMDDERSNGLKARARDIIASIRKGERDGIERKIDTLLEEAMNLKAIMDMQGIEAVLTDLEELDDLSKEVFRSIEGDEFINEKESISSFIAGLLERTSILYDRPDPVKVKEMSVSISQVRESIIALENRWRAKRRLLTLENIGVMDQAADDSELMGNINDARDSYKKGDFNRFFRTWERIEARLSKPQVKQIKKEAEQDDKAMQVLVRGRGPKRTDLSVPEKGKGRSFGGIKKLAKDMAEKRKLMEGVGDERREQRTNVPTQVDPQKEGSGPVIGIIEPAPGHSEAAPSLERIEVPVPEPYIIPNGTEDRLAGPIRIITTSSVEGEVISTKRPAGEGGPLGTMLRTVPALVVEDIQDRPSLIRPSAAEAPITAKVDDNDIAGIAKMIAGSRIEQLKRTESFALKEPAPDLTKETERDGPKGRVQSSDQQYACMMDEFLELDTSPKAKTREKDANEIRKKLECFFEKLPPNLRIDEAKAFYKKGVTLIEIDDSSGAIREFRLAISSAIKIGKLHADLSKALKTVRGTMDKQTSVGQEFLRIEKLYLKADEALDQGSLEDCAKFIKAIRNLLAAQMK